MFNYKRIIKNRKVRLKILSLCSFVPDKLMISIQYLIKTGLMLNLRNPKRYTEKLQWYKLYYRNNLMSKCVDKYEVRNYIKKSGYGDTLTELIGIYNNPNEIDFNKLPNQFVVKDTLGGGGTSIIICKDKNKLDKKAFIKELKYWISIKYKDVGREWVYDGHLHRIIIEKFIDSNLDEGGLIDYKFFCFNGRVEYIYTIADRKLGQKSGLGIFDREYNLLPYLRIDEAPLTRDILKPPNFDEMIKMAEKLAKPFPHVRVDLYDINENTEIKFGELTFFDGSGYMQFSPDEFDVIMGERFVLPLKMQKNFLREEGNVHKT